MTPSRPFRFLAPLVLLAGVGGCASLPHFTHWARIRPITPTAEHQIARKDGYYASAKSAIARRDYGQALELLQMAHSGGPDDIRILNAFGVIYDKLGRFDLSQRYYAEAKAIDPTSTVVANNMTYSAALQSKATLQSLGEAPATLSPNITAQPTQVAESRPAIVRLGFAPRAAAPIMTLALAGHSLVIADASGRKGVAEPVRRELARLGWSAPRVESSRAQAAANTTISYPAARLAIARALARTLPRGVELVECGKSCDAIQLTIGADSMNGRMKPPTTQTP
jgi:tetratricopeptide (TPR) repeat protein